MKLQELLNKHNEKNESKVHPKYPDWVSTSNASKDAFDAINEIFPLKADFIKVHNNKSDFKTKKHYQIQRSEIASMIGNGVSVQPLFNLNSYSEDLETYRCQRNSELLEMIDKKFSPSAKPSFKNRKKSTLLDELKAARTEISSLRETLAKEQLKLLLSKLPLDVKNKLNI